MLSRDKAIGSGAKFDFVSPLKYAELPWLILVTVFQSLKSIKAVDRNTQSTHAIAVDHTLHR